MVRRLCVCAAILALLQGFSAAPYTHAHHPNAPVRHSDGHPPLAHHAQGRTLVHSHTTPHAHVHAAPHQHDGEDGTCTEDHGERVWSLDSFVSKQAVVPFAPAPALIPAGTAHVALTGIAPGPRRVQPCAHGPPASPSSPLRGPPASLPALV